MHFGFQSCQRVTASTEKTIQPKNKELQRLRHLWSEHRFKEIYLFMCNYNNSEQYFLITRTLKHEQEINYQIQNTNSDFFFQFLSVCYNDYNFLHLT
jgi:hypothetical protein